ncbi:oxidoreductase AflY [Naviculisporaceae sp. PSN 640]
MGHNSSRAAFDGFLAKTHVEHALTQPDDSHNDLPTFLATAVFLDGTPDDLRAIYESQQSRLLSWSPSPENITDKEGRAQFLGDERFQRAYLTYFSMENGRMAGNARALAMSHLLTGAKPLIYGLFGGLGRPLIFLSDGMELRTAVMVVESLTLAAVDWTEPIYEILTSPQAPRQAQDFFLPGEIIGRLAYDGRFSGIMKSGPGFSGVTQIFTNMAAKAAIVDYLHQLDCRDPIDTLQDLSRYSVLLLCATHKPSAPAFDFYLSYVPTLINSARVLLVEFEEPHHQVVLIRGLWLLMILLYITQLRPVVDPELLYSVSMAPQNLSWGGILEQFQRRDAVTQGAPRDMQLLRTLRSLWELGKTDGEGGRLHLQAAWKLFSQWTKWTGREGEREETLNIRI